MPIPTEDMLFLRFSISFVSRKIEILIYDEFASWRNFAISSAACSISDALKMKVH